MTEVAISKEELSVVLFFTFQSNHFYNKLNEILDMVSKGNDSPGTLRKSNNYTPMTVFDIQYPELYVY